MTKWVALLRGVNVGGHKKLPMEALRSACKTAGFGEVQTYIQSGNLVFTAQGDADAIAKRLHTVLSDRFGIATPILVLAAAAMRDALAGCPFHGMEGNLVHAHFLFSRATLDEAAYIGLRTTSETVEMRDNVLWLYAPEGVGRSRLAGKIEKLVPDTITTGRNLNTVRKIVEMLDG